MHRRATAFIASAITLASSQFFAAPAAAQVDYNESGHPWTQRAESGPDAEVPGWFYNLGITGMRAELVADAPKSLVIRHVFAGTPASGVVLVGDHIIGAGGQLFREAHRDGYGEEVFGATGPIEEFAAALEAAQKGERRARETPAREDATSSRSVAAPSCLALERRCVAHGRVCVAQHAPEASRTNHPDIHGRCGTQCGRASARHQVSDVAVQAGHQGV
ncbi:MAG: hypothetical protein RL591_999 [Planctomycetota bacterium]